MNKILLIIKREYLAKVRKKTFLLMTILGPILMAALIVMPVYLANKGKEKRIIAIASKDISLFNKLEDSEYIHFNVIPDVEALALKNEFNDSPYYALLDIADSTFTLYSNQQISLNVSDEIKNQIEGIIKEKRLKKSGIDLDILKKANASIEISTIIVSEEGNKNSRAEVSMAIGFLSGILIYMFIFMYGTMVMRSVIEEKTSRIIEVIISSVKPFQLMMGKIIAVALVGLTQFILWIFLTIVISSIAEIFLLDIETISSNTTNMQQQSVIFGEITRLTEGINLTQIFLSFMFYFLAGYLMYSALFAAVGSAVDTEADTQQFILPITLPLILAFITAQVVIDNPDSSLALWMSIIPLTSPIIMMTRLPFGVENWELLLSMSILVISFIATTWLAAKIYRTGILMYGKKANYKELWKWLTYKG